MSTWVYGAAIVRQHGDCVVSVRDLPEVVTSGDDDAQALAMAADAIEVAIGYRMEKGEALPVAGPIQAGEHSVGLSALSTAKASLYEAWREAGISKSDLARRIGQGENEVRRVLSLAHRTKLDRLEEVAKALGCRIDVGLLSTLSGSRLMTLKSELRSNSQNYCWITGNLMECRRRGDHINARKDEELLEINRHHRAIIEHRICEIETQHAA